MAEKKVWSQVRAEAARDAVFAARRRLAAYALELALRDAEIAAGHALNSLSPST